MESIFPTILPGKFNLTNTQIQKLFEIVVEFRKKQISTFNEMKEKNIVSSLDKKFLELIDNQQSFMEEATSILLAVEIDCKSQRIPFYQALFNKGKGHKKNTEYINFYKDAIDYAILTFKEKQNLVHKLFAKSTIVKNNETGDDNEANKSDGNETEAQENPIYGVIRVFQKFSIQLDELLYIQDLFVNEIANLTIYELEHIKTNKDYQ